MGNTEDKKEDIAKKIPRNPNIPVKDDEVDALLKKAAEQVKNQDDNRENIDLKKKESAVKSEKSNEKNETVQKPEVKKEEPKKESVKKEESKKEDKKASSKPESKKDEEKDFKVEDEVDHHFPQRKEYPFP